MATTEALSLRRLEFLVYKRRHEDAAREVIRFLRHLDERQGELREIGIAPTGDSAAEVLDTHFATRIAAAVGTLFSDPNFQLSAVGFDRLIHLQRWLAIVFGASPFAHADHIVRLFNQLGYDRIDQIRLEDQDLLKFCLLYSLDSSIPLQPEVLWQKNKKLAACFFCALLSSRVVATEQAQDKREQLLAWLPSRLDEVTLDDIPVSVVHDVWMHCSYAHSRDKHAIKGAINGLVRKKLLATGFGDASTAAHTRQDKPVVMCVLEWFGSNHAMYRAHAPRLEALRSKYHVIGVSMREASDKVSRKVFDEVRVLRGTSTVSDTVREVCAIAAATEPAIVYYPSAGMFPETIFLVNLRLAPIQIVAMGHPATTHSPFIDYVVVPADSVGDPRCFSEKLIVVPPLPLRPPPHARRIPPKIRNAPSEVKIAVTASVMKLNHSFLNTLRRIVVDSKVPVQIHLFSGLAWGLTKVYLQNLIRLTLGERVVIYPHLPYDAYIEKLNQCDMFLNPFPFGNATGIVDTVRQELPGICLTGAEVHSHTDEALFKWLGMPSWTIAKSQDEYVKAAVRMAERSAEREKIARQLLKTDPDAVLFKGDATPFCDAFAWVHENHEALKSDSNRIVRPPRKATKRAR
jgi:HMW1C N-terminal/HMW1 domain 2